MRDRSTPARKRSHGSLNTVKGEENKKDGKAPTGLAVGAAVGATVGRSVGRGVGVGLLEQKMPT